MPQPKTRRTKKCTEVASKVIAYGGQIPRDISDRRRSGIENLNVFPLPPARAQRSGARARKGCDERTDLRSRETRRVSSLD